MPVDLFSPYTNNKNSTSGNDVLYAINTSPARTYQLPGALGAIRFITPASEHFCAACNCLRLTARGALRSCLFSDRAIETRGAPEPELPALPREAVRAKPAHHPLGEGFTILADTMAKIGG